MLPLVTLNFPDRDASAPPTMIALGLSAEAEAERVVQTALASFINLRPGVSTGARIVVLAGVGALERRVAQAYVNALRAAGELPLVVETTPAALNRLGRQLESGSYDAVFLALGAREASLVRHAFRVGLPIFGTSLLNVVTLLARRRHPRSLLTSKACDCRYAMAAAARSPGGDGVSASGTADDA